MLGELYEPTGKALETARAVLDTERVYACNVAKGCTNRCLYCYGSKRYRNVENVLDLPKKPPVELIKSQLRGKGKKSKQLVEDLNRDNTGIFFSFLTDPFIEQNVKNTMDTIRYISKNFPKVRIATLTKCEYPFDFLATSLDKEWLHDHFRLGVTVVSTYEKFWKKYEPNASNPHSRIMSLKELHDAGYYTWLSFEPDPSPIQFEHDPITDVLQRMEFVDLVVYGKWNYCKGCMGETAKNYYRKQIPRVMRFCKMKDISCFVKSETLKFVGGDRNE